VVRAGAGEKRRREGEGCRRLVKRGLRQTIRNVANEFAFDRMLAGDGRRGGDGARVSCDTCGYVAGFLAGGLGLDLGPSGRRGGGAGRLWIEVEEKGSYGPIGFDGEIRSDM
jgi:hypothetical protein